MGAALERLYMMMDEATRGAKSKDQDEEVVVMVMVVETSGEVPISGPRLLYACCLLGEINNKHRARNCARAGQLRRGAWTEAYLVELVDLFYFERRESQPTATLLATLGANQRSRRLRCYPT